MKKIPLKKIRCRICKKIFYAQRSANRKFCSIKCSGEETSKRQIGIKNPAWKKTDINKLIHDYKNGFSLTRLQKKYKISRDAIKYRFEKAGIKLKSFDTAVEEGIKNSKLWAITHKRDPNSNKGNRKNYLEIAKKSKKWKCEVCGKSRTNKHMDLIVHHKDGNNRNNKVNNLMILCQNHHYELHQAEHATIWEARL